MVRRVLGHRVSVEALIEEVQGLQNVEAICAADPRLECVVFGMGDYSASQGIAVKSGSSDSAKTCFSISTPL